jgi:2-polyprenyl-6-hydroxyphenyl methylase/3-demethylubiquinone-9 3-methyltransferase
MHGLEVSESGLAQGRGNYPQIQFHSVDLMQGLAELQMEGICDVVISTEVIEHVFLPRFFARSCWDLLTSGSTLIISNPYHGYLKNVALRSQARENAHPRN